MTRQLIDQWFLDHQMLGPKWGEEEAEEIEKYWTLHQEDKLYIGKTGLDYFVLGAYHYVRGENSFAITQFLVGAEQNHLQCIYFLCVCGQKTGQTDLWFYHCQRGVELGIVELNIMLASHYADQGNFPQMKQCYRRMIQAGDYRAYRNLYVHYQRQEWSNGSRLTYDSTQKKIKYAKLAYAHGDQEMRRNIVDHYLVTLKEEGFRFAVQHQIHELIRGYQEKGLNSRTFIHLLLSVSSANLFPGYRQARQIYLELLQHVFYYEFTYFRLLPRDIFTYVLLPYLDA